MNCLSNLPIEYQTDFIETDFKEMMVRICLERYANIDRVVFTSVSFICQNADIPMIGTAILLVHMCVERYRSLLTIMK